jgi:hypothetical protein
VDVDGLSGLTTAGDGTLWAVAESTRALVALVPGAAARIVDLEGVPDGLDTESIAWIDGSRFALGTESMDETRAADLVLFVDVGADRARVIDTIELPYAALAVAPQENRGIEGLCHAGGVLVAAMENVIEGDGSPPRRFAPLALRVRGEWTVTRAALTTETGKLSGLVCRSRSGVVEVLAIERHYEVMRVLRYAVEPGDDVIEAVVARDLRGRLDGDPNLEGITVDAAGGVVLVVDNHYGERTGPNELVRAPAVW